MESFSDRCETYSLARKHLAQGKSILTQYGLVLPNLLRFGSADVSGGAKSLECPGELRGWRKFFRSRRRTGGFVVDPFEMGLQRVDHTADKLRQLAQRWDNRLALETSAG